MNILKSIWPTLGDGYIGVLRNPSATKRGPGRRHSAGHQKQGRMTNSRGRRF